MSETSMTIKQMAASDRPREKFALQGADALSNSELLAILVRSGSNKETAIELTRRILSDCDNSLAKLQRLTLRQLQKYKGVGQVKAITIKAAAELARRGAMEEVGTQPVIRCPDDIARYFRPRIGDLTHEEVHVLYLNSRGAVIQSEMISRGGLNESSVDLRLVMKGALLCDAVSMALCHNHPSGSIQPSTQDDTLTNRLREAAKTMNIRLLDHIIVSTGTEYYSYNEEGKL